MEAFDQSSFDSHRLDLSAKLTSFNERFQTRVQPENGYFQSADDSVDYSAARWLKVSATDGISSIRPGFFAEVKKMYSGEHLLNGKKTLGLSDIGKWKINEGNRSSNIKQQAGFAAEVIGTAKENLLARVTGSELTTCRADDLPDKFSKNDQYVDKVRLDSSGNIVERIQTKFVGKDSASCLSKLTSRDYDKYITDGKVDKIEIPSEYYDDIKTKLLPKKIRSLEQQLERVKADGKTEVAEQKQAQLDKCKRLDTMLEKSTVSKTEAEFARLHPKRYAAKLFTSEIASAGHAEGVRSGLSSAGITVAISTVENVRGVMSGEITVQEAYTDIAINTGTAAVIGYGTGFVSQAVASAMTQSSHTLISSLGSTGVPSAVISFGIDSYDSVVSYAQGEISGAELAYDLGESATGVTGAMAGAQIGATVGTVAAGPVGTVAGGLVGGMVGYAVATGAYATAIEVVQDGTQVLVDKAETVAEAATETYAVVSEVVVDGAQVVGVTAVNVANAAADTFEVASTTVVEKAEVLKDKAVEMGKGVIDLVASTTPEAVDSVRTAMNNFASNLGISFNL
jgi:hypothetical protein